MIKVQYSLKNNYFQEISISGHANSNEYGKDLVCAAVSSIAVGILNAIEQECPNSCELEMDNGWVKISVLTYSSTLEIILKTLIYQLETIEFSYKKYIKIFKQEV